MYIIYDARHFEDYHSGLSRYSFSVLKELIREGSFYKLEIVLNSNYDYADNPLFLQIKKMCNENIEFIYLDAPIFSFKHNVTVSKYVNSTDCDLYFYPHFDIPIFIKKKSIFVIHDLFPLVLDSYVLRLAFLKKIYFRLLIYINLVKKTTQCIAVSKTTKKDIIRFFGARFQNKIEVFYEDSFSDFESESVDEKNFSNIINDEKYLFYIGGRRKHKNLKQMIDVFTILIEENLFNGIFVIAGSQKNFDFNLEEYAKDRKNIIVLDQVSDEELSLLYSKMESLFFLSKYEGFGLPIVEAAKHNKKIITSSLGACGEIAPSNSLKLDIEQDNYSLALSIAAYLNKEIKINNADFLKNFSWKNTVDYLLKIVHN